MAYAETDRPGRTDRLAQAAGGEGTDAAAATTDLSETLATEHLLIRHIVVDIAIAVPIAIAVVVGMIALAMSIDGAALGTPILMAVAFGVLAGVFFGTWAGFVSTAHTFEDLDRTQGRAQPRRPTARPRFGARDAKGSRVVLMEGCRPP